MDDDGLKRLRKRFAEVEEARPRSKVMAFVKKVTDRFGQKPKEDDLRRFQPKGRKKAS